jgi:hypothetical protein
MTSRDESPSAGGFDPEITLATSVHASPGVYALLLGSGVSSAAGIPTGWQVVTSLVQRAAVAAEPNNPQAPLDAAADPEAWWARHSVEPLGYSALLAQLAPTAASRQALLAGFFEPTEEDRQTGRKIPTAGHRAVARLVARGSVRVVLTTNFDRLIERALEDEGVSPQVLHDAGRLASATPLAHAPATVVKLHGDYADLEQRNTVDELSSYPPELTEFLTGVLDDYGLIVCGWSAEWDHALVVALESVRSRRYPLFWSTHGAPTEPARRLIGLHGAVLIGGLTADELFTGLLTRLEALDRLIAPPPSRDLAVVHLKRALADPTRRIEVFDLLDTEGTRIVDAAADRERHPLNAVDDREQVERYRADCDTLLHLLATGVFHDDGTYDALWTRILQRLLNVRGPLPAGPVVGVMDALRHLPALLAFWVAGVAAICARRERTLGVLLRDPMWTYPDGQDLRVNVGYALHPGNVLDRDRLNAWDGVARHYPASRLLRQTCREPLRLIEPDDEAYWKACDRLEYLVSLTQITAEHDWLRNPWLGEFYGERQILAGFPLADQVRSELTPDWPLVQAGLFTDVDQATEAVDRLSTWLSENRRRN